MSFANKHNTTKFFTADTTGYTYTNLETLYNQDGSDAIYMIEAMFINTKGKFGAQPCYAISSGNLVNIPKHMLSQTEEILRTPEDIEDINNHKVGFKIRKYHNVNYDRDCYSISFVDLAGDLPF